MDVIDEETAMATARELRAQQRQEAEQKKHQTEQETGGSRSATVPPPRLALALALAPPFHMGSRLAHSLLLVNGARGVACAAANR